MKKYLFGFVSAALFLAVFAAPAYTQCGPDGTQPCNTPKAKIAAAKSPASKQPAKPKTIPPSKSKKSDLNKLDPRNGKTSAKKQSDESIYRSLQLDPKTAGASNEMFPLNGVTPGRTTEAQLQILNAQRKTVVDETTKETRIYYTVKNNDFYLQNGMVDSIALFKFELMPQRWQALGFNWNLSFNQYVALLESLGFQIGNRVLPQQPIEPGKVFTARVFAYKKDGLPLEILTNFLLSNDKPSVNSPATMFWMLVRTPKQN